MNINSSGQKHRHLHVPQFQQILFSSNTRHSRKKFHLIKWYVFVLWCKLLKMRLYCCVAYFNNGPKTESSNLATYPSVYSMSVSSSRFFSDDDDYSIAPVEHKYVCKHDWLLRLDNFSISHFCTCASCLFPLATITNTHTKIEN